jgi:hypothetical protein
MLLFLSFVCLRSSEGEMLVHLVDLGLEMLVHNVSLHLEGWSQQVVLNSEGLVSDEDVFRLLEAG